MYCDVVPAMLGLHTPSPHAQAAVPSEDRHPNEHKCAHRLKAAREEKPRSILIFLCTYMWVFVFSFFFVFLQKYWTLYPTNICICVQLLMSILSAFYYFFHFFFLLHLSLFVQLAIHFLRAARCLCQIIQWYFAKHWCMSQVFINVTVIETNK